MSESSRPIFHLNLASSVSVANVDRGGSLVFSLSSDVFRRHAPLVSSFRSGPSTAGYLRRWTRSPGLDVPTIIHWHGFAVGHWWQGRVADCAGLLAIFVVGFSGDLAPFFSTVEGNSCFFSRLRVLGRAPDEARAAHKHAQSRAICRRSALSRWLSSPGPRASGAAPPRDWPGGGAAAIAFGAARRRTCFWRVDRVSRPGEPMAPRRVTRAGRAQTGCRGRFQVEWAHAAAGLVFGGSSGQLLPAAFAASATHDARWPR